eukprot:6189085-Pleurochrysis_carterae.AAC.1
MPVAALAAQGGTTTIWADTQACSATCFVCIRCADWLQLDLGQAWRYSGVSIAGAGLDLLRLWGLRSQTVLDCVASPSTLLLCTGYCSVSPLCSKRSRRLQSHPSYSRTSAQIHREERGREPPGSRYRHALRGINSTHERTAQRGINSKALTC